MICWFVREHVVGGILDGACGCDNLMVIVDAFIDWVLVDGCWVRGVVVLVVGELFELVVELVIVCAGVFGSLGVLLCSGIGVGVQFVGLGIVTVVDLFGVGVNF